MSENMTESDQLKFEAQIKKEFRSFNDKIVELFKTRYKNIEDENLQLKKTILELRNQMNEMKEENRELSKLLSELLLTVS